MSVQKASVEYVDDHFIGTDEFGSIQLDWFESGVTPIKAVLMAAAACSLMDVVTILRKRRVDHTVLRADVEAEKADNPSRLTRLHIILTTDAPLNEVERAVKLSHDKYCTVVNTINGVTDVTYEIVEVVTKP